MLRKLLMVIALLPAPGNVLYAQLAGGLSLDGGLGQVGSSPWLRQSRLAPSLRYASPLGALQADGMFAERAGVISLDRASLAGLMASPAVGGFRLSADGAYERDGLSTHAIARVSPAISYRHGRVGGWFGSAHEQSAAPALHAGLFTSVRSAIITISSRTTNTTFLSVFTHVVPDSTRIDTGGYDRFRRVVSDTTSTNSGNRWSQLDARFDWSGGRVALTAMLSSSFSATTRRDSASPSGRWGRVNASYQIHRRLALTAGAGTYPRSQPTTSRAGRFATLGVRFAPTMFAREPLAAPVRPVASSFSIRQIEPGLYHLVLRVPSARTVELSGDFNRWTAVTMQQTAPGVWEVALPLQPGTHRLNVRVDGDSWTAPPGLPAVNDEFSGRVGILVVR